MVIPRLRQVVRSVPGQPRAAHVGRRLRLRHRSPRPTCRASRSRPTNGRCSTSPRSSPPTRSTGFDRSGSSPSSKVSAAAGRHSSRRCTTRSPTARAACSCRSSSSTSSVMRSRRRCPTPTRSTSPTEHADDDAAEVVRDFLAATFRLPDRRRSPDARACSTTRPDPRRRCGRSRHAPRHRRPTRRHRRSSEPALDRTVARPPPRSGVRAVPADEGRVEGARRHAQHRIPDHRHRGGQPVPRRTRRAGRRAAGVDGDQHPHRRLRGERVLARPDARADG